MARASTQHKLDRVRPPRVQVTYDVEIGNAIEIKELPFLVGVLGDFNGMPLQPLPRLRDRKFVEVNPDNFDAVLETMNPHLAYSVENKLTDNPDAGQMRVDLHFKSFQDFEPANVAKQVKPLRELYELRVKLADLLGTLQGNDRLNDVLLDAVTNADKLTRLRSEIGTKQPPAAVAEAAVEPRAKTDPAIVENEPAAVDAAASIETEAEPAAEASRETEPVATVGEPVGGPTESADEAQAAAAETEAVNEAEAGSAGTETDTETEPVVSETYGDAQAPESESETPEPESRKAEPER